MRMLQNLGHLQFVKLKLTVEIELLLSFSFSLHLSWLKSWFWMATRYPIA